MSPVLIVSSSFLINFLFLNFLFKRSNQLGLLDYPDKRKQHKNPVPLIGGLSLYLTFFLLVFLMFNNFLELFHNANHFLIYLISSSVIFAIGLIDDLVVVSTFKKIFIQIVVVFVVVYYLELYKQIYFLFNNNYCINFFIATLFLLGVTNSINLIDGTNNLMCIISIFSSISFIIISNYIGVNNLFFLYIIIGSGLSYIVYNNFFENVFFGDSGSLYIGWLLSIASIVMIKSTNSFTFHIPMLILAIPAFDTVFVMVNRFFKSEKDNFIIRFKSMFLSDRTHIHHFLLNRGFSDIEICFVLGCVSVLFFILSFFILVFIKDYFYKTNILMTLFLVYFFIRLRLYNNN